MSPRYESASTVTADLRISAQVVVIGSGAGGAVAAKELAAAGLDVVLLEEGPWVGKSDYGHLSVIEATRRMYRDVGLSATQGDQPVLVPMGRGVGGTTLINLGTALRMEPPHFQKWLETGLESLSWDELQRLYARVAEHMPVAPVPEAMLGGNTRKLIEGARALGYQGHVLDRFAEGCEGRARCFAGCPTDGKKSSMHLNYVPRALEAGARLYTDCRVERIVVGRGGVTGVTAWMVARREARGHRVEVRAPHVVVACGAMLSPILLERSGISRNHPDRGRHLRVHPACRAIGLFEEVIDGHLGVPQAYHVPPTDSREIYLETVFLPPALMGPALHGSGPEHRELMRQYRHLALAGFRFIEKGSGRVRPGPGGLPRVDYPLAGPDLVTMREGLVASARLLFAAGARRVYVPVHGFEKLESAQDVERLARLDLRAGDLEVSGYHAHGTLRMGSDPRWSVVDEDGEHHEVKGLHVADASLFPASSRVNPQFTVMALATRVAEAIVRQIKQI